MTYWPPSTLGEKTKTTRNRNSLWGIQWKAIKWLQIANKHVICVQAYYCLFTCFTVQIGVLCWGISFLCKIVSLYHEHDLLLGIALFVFKVFLFYSLLKNFTFEHNGKKMIKGSTFYFNFSIIADWFGHCGSGGLGVVRRRQNPHSDRSGRLRKFRCCLPYPHRGACSDCQRGSGCSDWISGMLWSRQREQLSSVCCRLLS